MVSFQTVRWRLQLLHLPGWRQAAIGPGIHTRRLPCGKIRWRRIVYLWQVSGHDEPDFFKNLISIG
jgi:hypothetical protein